MCVQKLHERNWFPTTRRTTSCVIVKNMKRTTGFQHVSFVNSIATTKGGTHVNHVVEPLVVKIMDRAREKLQGGFRIQRFSILECAIHHFYQRIIQKNPPCCYNSPWWLQQHHRHRPSFNWYYPSLCQQSLILTSRNVIWCVSKPRRQEIRALITRRETIQEIPPGLCETIQESL